MKKHLYKDPQTKKKTPKAISYLDPLKISPNASKITNKSQNASRKNPATTLHGRGPFFRWTECDFPFPSKPKRAQEKKTPFGDRFFRPTAIPRRPTWRRWRPGVLSQGPARRAGRADRKSRVHGGRFFVWKRGSEGLWLVFAFNLHSG